MTTRAIASQIAALVLVAATVLATDARVTDSPFPEFVEIPAGPFIMGAAPSHDPEAFDNERWPNAEGEGTVDLPTFYISRHEVTVAQFATLARANGWRNEQTLSGPPTHPVTFVTWPEALMYCRWLETTLKGSSAPSRLQTLVREGWHVRLPNEAQWEKAARGGDRRRYPWGNEPRANRANYRSEGTTPVGQFACPECPYGLADMSGNVWEWTSSPYQPYPYDRAVNLEADALWVIRGGHFGDEARLVRTTTRGAADPGARRPFIGFRVVLTMGK